MEQKILSSLGGVGIYGIISICIFFAFFTVMLVWTIALKPKYLNRMGDLPLDGEEKDSSPKNES